MTRNPGKARSPASAERAVGAALDRDPDLRRFLLALAWAVVDAGGAAYLVGGYLRDIAGGRPAGDVDVMVAGMPHGALEEALGNLARTGLGIRKIVPAGRHFPVFRVAADWRAGYIDIHTARGHGEVHGLTPSAFALADAARRDFTVNAILFELAAAGSRLDGKLIDPFGGIRDLARRTIRCVGSPGERFREDPVRLIRAIRLRNEWPGFSIDPKTLRAIRRLVPALLPTVPADRLIPELIRSLQANPSGALADLRRTGILRVVLPELSRRKAGAARAERRCQSLTRSLRRSIPPAILLANLLVDLPPSDAESAARRLRFPNVRHLLATVSDLRALQRLGQIRYPLAETETILRRRQDPGPFIALYHAAARCDGIAGKPLRRFLKNCLKTPVFIVGSDLKEMGYPEGPLREEAVLAVRDATLGGTIRSRERALVLARWFLAERRGAETAATAKPTGASVILERRDDPP